MLSEGSDNERLKAELLTANMRRPPASEALTFAFIESSDVLSILTTGLQLTLVSVLCAAYWGGYYYGADPLIVELFGPEGEGTMVVAGFWKGRTEQAQAFDDKLLARLEANGIHKLGAHHSDAQAYDGVYLLKQVMEAAGVTGDPAKVEEERAAILAQMEGVVFDGIVGDDVCFDSNHDAELPGYVIEIKDGAWTKFAEASADTCE